MLDKIEINPKKHPEASVIWLHGLGADGHDFSDIVPQLALPEKQGVRFIFPHAPLRPVTLAQGASIRAWFDITALSIDGINSDEAAIYASQKAIETLIEQEIARGIPSQKIVLAGFSQGGSMALQCGLRYAKTLAGILVLSGFLPLADKLKAEKNPANQNTPILMLHGELDNVIPLPWAKVSYQNLLELNYNVHWQDYVMQHTVCEEEISTIGRWLQQVLT